ncbi:MAG: hypothetical protein FWH38_10420 [Treponema sp.]|nr:hypothetical protein [Treponema sp.]
MNHCIYRTGALLLVIFTGIFMSSGCAHEYREDVWESITSLQQLNGTWTVLEYSGTANYPAAKYFEKNKVSLTDEDMIILYSINALEIFEETITYSVDDNSITEKSTSTVFFSGSDMDTAWQVIYGLSFQIGQMGNYAFDSDTYSIEYSWKYEYNIYDTKIKEILSQGWEINQFQTKIRDNKGIIIMAR